MKEAISLVERVTGRIQAAEAEGDAETARQAAEALFARVSVTAMRACVEGGCVVESLLHGSEDDGPVPDDDRAVEEVDQSEYESDLDGFIVLSDDEGAAA